MASRVLYFFVRSTLVSRSGLPGPPAARLTGQNGHQSPAS